MATRSLPPARRHTLKAVQTISGDDIGRVVRFYQWDAAREIGTVTTAELRQISHMQGRTSITYGLGAEREESFEEGESICFDPPADYSDVTEIKQAFYDFHGLDNQETH
ncbi:hypothetical protein I5G59_gp58 [Mycobacterium phage LilMcDreamy]|uniref:Uncharacterized protein n=1 Tax=Mycobacterium phage LilMcDreamy TaxID=2652422 RepID=A0A5P8D6R1_9CAUD|nr:hypothetical protein I5G59_gp58 [Mycobacterium phage LilMcDreamy]QFP94678.1 hypothetical protein SEA_LILMCDREAMY_58 [Mycobacterium phage LilMcDreamy]